MKRDAGKDRLSPELLEALLLSLRPLQPADPAALRKRILDRIASQDIVLVHAPSKNCH